MSYHTFGPGLALDHVTMKGIPAMVGQLEDADTGEPVQAYTMGSDPTETLVITNRFGYYGQFQVDSSVRRLIMRFGSFELVHIAWEIISEAANDTEIQRAITRANQALTLIEGEDQIPPILHLNGPEYGVDDYTAATSTFSNLSPGELGEHYTYDTLGSLQHLRSRGWTVVKLPIRWERIQDTIGGPLKASELDLLIQFLSDCQAVGLKCIIDIHNYGLYYEDVGGVGTRRAIGSAALPISAFTNLWTRLAQELSDHPAVFGYALMAEPQSAGGMTGEIWREASQAAVTAIRAIDTISEIHVAGWEWSNLAYWTYYNGPTAWISDPSGGVIRYEAHHYWDSDFSGEYSNSYAAEVTAAQATYTAGGNPDALYTRVFTELEAFNAWLTQNNVTGIIGEMGWPGSVDSAQWNALGAEYIRRTDEMGIACVPWFAGEWAWSGDDLRIYEGSTPLSTPRNQAPVWENRLATGPAYSRGVLGQLAALEARIEALEN